MLGWFTVVSLLRHVAGGLNGITGGGIMLPTANVPESRAEFYVTRLKIACLNLNCMLRSCKNDREATAIAI